MLFEVQFLRRHPGQAEPERLEVPDAKASDLQAAKNLAMTLWQDLARDAGAEGYRIVEDGELEVYIWWSPDVV